MKREFILTLLTIVLTMYILPGCGEYRDSLGDKKVSVTKITLDKNSLPITVGKSESLIATIIPENATNTNFSWKSNDSAIATVSQAGVVTGVSEGNTIIVVTTEDGGFNDFCSVYVTTAPLKAGDKITSTIDSVSFKLTYIPAKTFPTGVNDAGTTTISTAYWLGETEVTYELWSKVYDWAIINGYFFSNTDTMGDGSGDTVQHPVTNINWRDSMVWCNALTEWSNAKNGTMFTCVYKSNFNPIRDSRDSNSSQCDSVISDTNANGFRLPTSNEWELAARYKNDSNTDGDILDADEYYPGTFASGATANTSDASATDLVSWYVDNSSVHAVKGKSANILGLYDMSGNVAEFCFDVTSGTGRVSRGGSILSPFITALQVGRIASYPSYREDPIQGFRLVRNL